MRSIPIAIPTFCDLLSAYTSFHCRLCEGLPAMSAFVTTYNHPTQVESKFSFQKTSTLVIVAIVDVTYCHAFLVKDTPDVGLMAMMSR